MNVTLEDLGMEVIDFQHNSRLFSELTIFFTQYRGAVNDDRKKEILNSIHKCIFERTGLKVNVTVHVADYYSAWVEVPRLTARHPLFGPAMSRNFRHGLIPLVKINEGLKGGVDRKTSKVFGSFSEVPHEVGLTSKFFTTDLITPEEVASAVIHELGHLYTYYEFVGHFYSANYFLMAVAEAWTDTGTREQRATVLKNLQAYYTEKVDNADAIADAKNPEVPAAVVVATAIAKFRRQQGSKFYDQRTWEFMSDQFAVRHGAGKALVMLLDKMARSVSLIHRQGAYLTGPQALLLNALHVAWQGVGFAITFGGPQGIAFSVGWGVKQAVLNVCLSFSSTLIVNMIGDPAKSYDDPIERYTAMRRDMIQALKDPRIKPENRTQILEDMLIIDEAIRNLNAYGDRVTTMLFDFIYDTVLTGRGSALKLQRDYETLANNELFVKAAQFSQLR